MHVYTYMYRHSSASHVHMYTNTIINAACGSWPGWSGVHTICTMCVCAWHVELVSYPTDIVSLSLSLCLSVCLPLLPLFSFFSSLHTINIAHIMHESGPARPGGHCASCSIRSPARYYVYYMTLYTFSVIVHTLPPTVRLSADTNAV